MGSWSERAGGNSAKNHPFSGASPFYYLGWAFLALKAVTVLLHWIQSGGRRLDALAGPDMQILSWRLGKIAPIVFCASFLVDAILLKRKTILFWSILTVFAFALTIYVVVFYKR